MCGKAAVSNLSWAEVFAYARSLTPPPVFPTDPQSRVNISPSRLRRKSDPASMVWETLPVIHCESDMDHPAEAIWPFLPVYSEGRLPMNRLGRIISTANARLKTEAQGGLVIGVPRDRGSVMVLRIRQPGETANSVRGFSY
jgi:hypothetical protein